MLTPVATRTSAISLMSVGLSGRTRPLSPRGGDPVGGSVGLDGGAREPGSAMPVAMTGQRTVASTALSRIDKKGGKRKQTQYSYPKVNEDLKFHVGIR